MTGDELLDIYRTVIRAYHRGLGLPDPFPATNSEALRTLEPFSPRQGLAVLDCCPVCGGRLLGEAGRPETRRCGCGWKAAA